MRLIYRFKYLLAATVPVVALAACSGGASSSSAASGPPEQSTIVLDAVPTGDAAGIYIAKDDGLFAKQGLNVIIRPINGGEVGMPDIQDGKAQLLEGNYVSFILAQMAGTFGLPHTPKKPIDMRMIADTSQMQPGNQALYVLPNSPYKTVADLAKDHATIGINTANNIGQVFLGSLFQADNLKLGSIRQWIAPDLPNMPLYLAQHKVDSAWLPEPFGTVAEQKYGAVPIADFDEGALQAFPIGTVVGTKQWVQSHPNTIAAFLRAYKQGQEIADTNRAAVEQALLKNVPGMTRRIAATMTLDTYPLVMDVPVMQRVANAMYQFGVIHRKFNITSMIQPEPDEIK